MPTPKVKADPQKVLVLAQKGMTVKEIAAFFRCTQQTIYNNFREQLDMGHANLAMTLREKQIEMALNGAPQQACNMLIHLGKSYLKQGQEATISAEGGDVKEFKLEMRVMTREDVEADKAKGLSEDDILQ